MLQARCPSTRLAACYPVALLRSTCRARLPVNRAHKTSAAPLSRSQESEIIAVSALEFHPLHEQTATPARMVELLQAAKAVLEAQGMADMDEYGDMLKWGLPKQGGACRNIHVFHPDWCSFSDAFRGTIHYHGGEIRGTVLLGEMEHYTYEPRQAADGNRFLAGQAFFLQRHTSIQGAGTSYALAPMVPHWLKPTQLTLTYFEEDDTERMGDLVNPATDDTDDHVWEQPQADALLPELLRRIDARLAALTAPERATPTLPS